MDGLVTGADASLLALGNSLFEELPFLRVWIQSLGMRLLSIGGASKS
jgi:hypothetical protein